MPSITEIQLNKLRAHFRARFAPMIWANCVPLNVCGGGDYNFGANQAGKRATSYLIDLMLLRYVSDIFFKVESVNEVRVFYIKRTFSLPWVL